MTVFVASSGLPLVGVKANWVITFAFPGDKPRVASVCSSAAAASTPSAAALLCAAVCSVAGRRQGTPGVSPRWLQRPGPAPGRKPRRSRPAPLEQGEGGAAPIRSENSTGPSGQLKPSRIAVSMSAAVPTSSSRAKAVSLAIWATRRGGSCRRRVDPRQVVGVEGRGRQAEIGVVGAVAPVAVAVVALAALAPELARLDHLFLNRARSPSLRMPALLVEGAGDAEVDVEPDQVDQLERAPSGSRRRGGRPGRSSPHRRRRRRASAATRASRAGRGGWR